MLDNANKLHIAIIIKGNAKWSKARGLDESFGYVQGAKRVEEIVAHASRLGIGTLTLGTCSNGNDALMSVLRQIALGESGEIKRKVLITFIGDKVGLSEATQRDVLECEEQTKGNKGLHLQVALNYGGRDDVFRAVCKMLRSGIKASDVSEQMIAAHLDTANVPDPDLVIVTGGEKGTADFLLWQAAYAEYDFVDVCWPEFTSAHFDASLLKLQSRDRRFGGVPTATAAE